MSALGLQNSLPNCNLTRDYRSVSRFFYDMGFPFHEELQARAKSGDELTVLDVGCGAGTCIEEITRCFKGDYPEKEIRAIGVDPNPLPEMICFDSRWQFHVDVMNRVRKVYDLENDPTKEYRFSELRVGTAEDMPVEDNSVDVGYSIATLLYVADTLKALEEGYRVLRPGGIFAWDIDSDNLLAKPSIDEILDSTPGGRDVFSYENVFGGRKGCRQVIVCRKKEGDVFNGFPFEMVDVLKLHANTEFHRRFFVRAIYEALDSA